MLTNDQKKSNIFVILIITLLLALILPFTARASTIYLTDSGWSDPNVGTWDPVTLTGTLTTDVSETIQIDSDNVTLNGNGFTVVGPGLYGGSGIYLNNRTGVTIQNVNVQDCTYAIYLFASSDCTLAENTISNSSSGIMLHSSNNNTLKANTTSDNTYNGIYLYKSTGNTIEDNITSNNTYNGIYLYSTSSNNTVTGNTATFNECGIYLYYGSRSNVVMDNACSDNKLGYRIKDGSHYNRIQNNTANDNEYFGFAVQRCFNNWLGDNFVNSNGYGIYIDNCNSTCVENNTTINNAYSGIRLYDSIGVMLISNTSNSNLNGIDLWDSPRSRFESNHVSENDTGILLERSEDSVVVGSTAISNNNIGIYINGAESVFRENFVAYNQHGFLLEGSVGNILYLNTILENDCGIKLYETSQNVIYYNNFIDNLTQADVWHELNDYFYWSWYPLGGNFWSDWCPPDHPDTNHDGFVDQWYELIENGSSYTYGCDRYPLANEIPWNQSPEATITGPASGSIHALADGVLLEGSIYDPDIDRGDTHTALWTISNEDWTEDFELEGTVTGTSVSDMLYFSDPGIYNIALTVTDSKGASDTTTTVNNQEDMPASVVIYDPDGGSVTGGGWIWSPAGAYAADATLEGQANFGFVSRYKKGAAVPTGNTEFQFQAAGLNFHISEYEWLVVTGNDRAKFKGTGTINGQGIYRVMLWAGDGDLDTFRIRIWTEDEAGLETLVYDNGDENQSIGGGSIVIHNPE